MHGEHRFDSAAAGSALGPAAAAVDPLHAFVPLEPTPLEVSPHLARNDASLVLGCCPS
jgi:hypothetical protein